MERGQQGSSGCEFRGNEPSHIQVPRTAELCSIKMPLRVVFNGQPGFRGQMN